MIHQLLVCFDSGHTSQKYNTKIYQDDHRKLHGLPLHIFCRS
uniref:Uncharacterized protein n=1 Tax=Arundo donax TaxID=35708 RepID=A0A0A9BTW4_ARUDO